MIELISTFLMAMTPIGELRLAIPVALSVYKLNWITAYILSVIGNIIPVLIILTFLNPVSKWLSSKFKFFNKFFTWLFKRTRKKHEEKIEKWGSIALISFVAIPLPITGGWTGSLVAFLFDIPFKKSFPLISAGILVAGAIVTILTKTGIAIGSYFGWQVLIGIILIISLSYAFYKKLNKNHV